MAAQARAYRGGCRADRPARCQGPPGRHAGAAGSMAPGRSTSSTRPRQIIERINAYFGYAAVAQLSIVQAPIGAALPRSRLRQPAGRAADAGSGRHRRSRPARRARPPRRQCPVERPRRPLTRLPKPAPHADLPYSAPILCYLLAKCRSSAASAAAATEPEEDPTCRDRPSDDPFAPPPAAADRGRGRSSGRRRRLGLAIAGPRPAQEGGPDRGVGRGADEARPAARPRPRQGRRAHHGGRVRLHDLRPLRQLPQHRVPRAQGEVHRHRQGALHHARVPARQPGGGAPRCWRAARAATRPSR